MAEQHQIFMPLISSSQPTIVPMGWAIYGVPHSVNHQELEAGKWVQDWWITRCCLTWPNYMPCLRDIYHAMFIDFDALADVASRFSGHTCLLWNEPDVPSQAWLNARNAVEMSRRWMQAIRPHWKVAGFGVTIVAPDHWLMATGGWRRWLDEYLHYGGDLPDVWHVHVYSSNDVDAWRRYYDAWQMWNEANGNLPTILSEVGQGSKVWEYLNRLVDSRIERMLWFTNFTDVPMTGIP